LNIIKDSKIMGDAIILKKQEKTANSETSQVSLKREIDNIDPDLTHVILPWVLRHPRYLRAGFRLMRAVKKAKQARVESNEKGLMVPPFLILSITSQCNLFCNGCFAAGTGVVNNGKNNIIKNEQPQLEYHKWHSIISEASELGVMGFIIGGGEPFLFPDLLDLCLEFKDRIFVILTNGTILSPEDYKKLKRSTNIAIIVSIEGGRSLTDARRGDGVFENAMNVTNHLNKIGVPNGISVTITRNNFKYWMDENNIDDFIAQGVRLGVFLEYIPQTPHSDNNSDLNLMLTSEERSQFRAQMLDYRANKSLYIIHSPGDEEEHGGCVSAGRGFAHITPNGDLTPCPVSNVATHNIITSSLKDGLASPLFEEIRKNEHILENEGTPCALFAHPKEVEALTKAVGAYRVT
jgi:MoaA/NifB/PqqE/SkfB family radical SAM enzyme